MALPQLLSTVLESNIFNASLEDDIIYYEEYIQFWDEDSKYFRLLPISKEIDALVFMDKAKNWFFDKQNLSIFAGKKMVNENPMFEAILLNSDLKTYSTNNEFEAVFELCMLLEIKNA